jgi:hypothetical protein
MTIEEVITILTNGKVLLQFSHASVIEDLRRSPEKYNDPLVRRTSSII